MAWLRALLVTLLLSAALVVGLCFGLYAMGASQLSGDLEPSRYHVPPEVRALYLKVEAGDVDHVPRLNPVTVWGYWLWHVSGNNANRWARSCSCWVMQDERWRRGNRRRQVRAGTSPIWRHPSTSAATGMWRTWWARC